VDARVSVPTNPGGIPGTGGTFWTMHLLNFFYQKKSGKADFESLFDNSQIEREAPELHSELHDRESELQF
jgi:hypothetical protein